MDRDRYRDFGRVEDDCQELIDAGQRVISLVITRTRGRSSGIDTEFRQYGVWTIRDGKVIRVEWFRRRAEALEAAGLSE